MIVDKTIAIFVFRINIRLLKTITLLLVLFGDWYWKCWFLSSKKVINDRRAERGSTGSAGAANTA